MQGGARGGRVGGVGTLVLDFDSTLVPCESLEEALARAPGVGAAERARLADITRLGMEGALPFADSLRARLAIAHPTRAGLTALGEELVPSIAAGAAELVAQVAARGHETWIVSGAFRETLLPAARALGVPEARVLGVRARWHDDGSFASLDPADGFSHSKVEGVRRHPVRWPRPAVGVGDGATDLALRDAGLVDTFIAYCGHVRRRSVAEAPGVIAVDDVRTLALHLEELLP